MVPEDLVSAFLAEARHAATVLDDGDDYGFTVMDPLPSVVGQCKPADDDSDD